MKDEELKAQINDIIEGEIQNGINDYLEAQEDKDDSGVGFVEGGDKKLNVKVDNFSYPQKDGQTPFSLSGIEITGMPGELIGIVGQSGCGKSTLLKILSTDIVTAGAEITIESKEEGKSVSLSGSDLNSLLTYKSQVCIVSQDSHVFSASLKFNITMSYGEEGRFNQFWEEVKTSIPYLKSWGIEGDSEINVKELSLGQKQLISALRSCYLSKPIVLFDEISSALDSELEEALRLLVLMIQKKSLTFIVAHRIETIVNADQIIVMQNGRIVDRGIHSGLLENSTPYQDFISQLSGN